jgi:hypothetical protein
MSVRRLPVSAALVGAALTVATVLAAPSASAATKTWTVTRGGAVTATAKSLTVVDITNGESLPCGSSVVKVKLKSGKHLPGTDAGTLTSATFTGCDIAGFSITGKATHLPWHLNLVSYNSAKGVTTATLTGIHITLSVPAIGCMAVADGTGAAANNGALRMTYTNKTGKLATLKTGGKLHLFDVSKNCDGVVSDGDSVALIATYQVSPVQKITSP